MNKLSAPVDEPVPHRWRRTRPTSSSSSKVDVTTLDARWVIRLRGDGARPAIARRAGPSGIPVIAFASGSWSRNSTTQPLRCSRSPASVASPFLVGPLVSNTGQTSETLPSDELTDKVIKLAQTFTTGAEPSGYALSSIGVKFIVIGNTSTVGRHLRVTLNANTDGNPGDALCTLDDPASFTASGVQTFDAPEGCPTLAASTTYFVVIERVEDDINDPIQPSLVGSNWRNEDPGGAAGWSIGDGRHSLDAR